MGAIYRIRYLISATFTFAFGLYFLITGLVGYSRINAFKTGGEQTTATITRAIKVREPGYYGVHNGVNGYHPGTGNYDFGTYSYYVNRKLFTGHTTMGYDLGTKLKITYLKAKPWISGETYEVTSPLMYKINLVVGAVLMFFSLISIIFHLAFPVRRIGYQAGSWNLPF